MAAPAPEVSPPTGGATVPTSEVRQIDRIVASDMREREPGVSKLAYLVKWRGKPYTDLTWEFSDDLQHQHPQHHARLVEDYRRLHTPPTQPLPPPLPHRLWVRADASPEYRNTNALRQYQLEGLNWLIKCWCEGRGSILADERGLGKTAQVVAFFEHLRAVQLLPGPFLVVAPPSEVTAWEREIQEWTGMNVVVFQGGRENREETKKWEWFFLDEKHKPVSNMIKFHVLVASYETLTSAFEDISQIHWQVAVADEPMRLKKDNCGRVLRKMGEIRSYHRIILSSVAMKNSYRDTWPLCFVDPVKFPDTDAFVKRFGYVRDHDQVQALQAASQQYVLRRMLADLDLSIAAEMADGKGGPLTPQAMRRKTPANSAFVHCPFKHTTTPEEDVAAHGNRLRFYRRLTLERRSGFGHREGSGDKWDPPETAGVGIGTFVSTWVTGNKILGVAAIVVKPSAKVQLYLKESPLPTAANDPKVAAIMAAMPSASGRNPVPGYPHDKKQGDLYIVRADLVTIVWSLLPGFGVAQQLIDDALAFANGQIAAMKASDLARQKERSVSGADQEDDNTDDEEDVDEGGPDSPNPGSALKRKSPDPANRDPSKRRAVAAPPSQQLLVPSAANALVANHVGRPGLRSSTAATARSAARPPSSPDTGAEVMGDVDASPPRAAGLGAVAAAVAAQGVEPPSSVSSSLVSMLQASMGERSVLTQTLLEVIDRQREDMTRMMREHSDMMREQQQAFLDSLKEIIGHTRTQPQPVVFNPPESPSRPAPSQH